MQFGLNNSLLIEQGIPVQILPHATSSSHLRVQKMMALVGGKNKKIKVIDYSIFVLNSFLSYRTLSFDNCISQ